MKTLVIGAGGQIGAYAVQDLVEFYNTEIIAADRRLVNLKKVMDDMRLSEKVRVMELEAGNIDAVVKTVKSEGIETVVNCAWYQTNLSVMGACLRAGAHYTDLGGLFDTTLGDTLPIKQAGWPSYSIRTVMDEFTEEPVMWLDGRHVKQPVLSGETTITMQEPVGTINAYYVKHSEPATLGKYVGKGCRNVTFRIGFPSTDFATFKTLKNLGFAETEEIEIGGNHISPLDFLTAMYQRASAKARQDTPRREEYEYDAFRIDVFGILGGSPTTVTYHMITWNDPQRGISSARDTASPPAVVSHWQATGKIKEAGVFPAEATVDPEPFFIEMGKRKIRVEEDLAKTKKFY
jgi:saccharopine dehydrogenase-like NADP-dependent oxidoreductase